MHFFFLTELIANKLLQAFCWMLVHSLWQGLIITICCGIAILSTKKQSSLLRYNIITLLFFSFLSVCLFTFIKEYGDTSLAILTDLNVVTTPGNSFLYNFYELQRLLVAFTNYCSLHADFLVVCWFLVFLFKISRLMRSLLYIKKVRNKNITKAPGYWASRLAQLSAEMGMKNKVLLLQSAIVKIPFITGYFKPIIFVPLGLLSHLPVEQVEAVLMHELAHIRRNDYCINFLQHLVETVFFFNPALLWMSSLMKEERENCCDDIALHHTKNKKQFLEALISFKEFAATNLHSYAIAFPGKRNQLLQRFQRIITNQNKSLAVSEKLFLLTSLFIFTIFCAAVSGRAHHKENIGNIKISKTVDAVIYKKTEQKNLVVSNKITSHIEHTIKKYSPRVIIEEAEKDVQGDGGEAASQANIPPHEKEMSPEYLKAVALSEVDKNMAELKKLQAEESMELARINMKMAEEKKMQSRTDAQQAYADAEQARKSYQESKAASQAILTRNKALLMKQQAEDMYQKLQHLNSASKN